MVVSDPPEPTITTGLRPEWASLIGYSNSRRIPLETKYGEKQSVGFQCVWIALGRVAFSLLCAGVFYLLWMAVFLVGTSFENTTLEAVLWLSAPPITAIGFAGGIAIWERLTGTKNTDFLHIFIWPLIGCSIGAGVIYWFGPMLIVFGMFSAGTASVVMREAVMRSRRRRT